MSFYHLKKTNPQLNTLLTNSQSHTESQARGNGLHFQKAVANQSRHKSGWKDGTDERLRDEKKDGNVPTSKP